MRLKTHPVGRGRAAGAHLDPVRGSRAATSCARSGSYSTHAGVETLAHRAELAWELVDDGTEIDL
jgi:hypothetical protein